MDFYLASWTPLTGEPELRKIFKAWLGGRGLWLSMKAHKLLTMFLLLMMEEKFLNGMACKQVFKIINHFPEGHRQVGEQTRQLGSWALSMTSYTTSAPLLPGSQCPPSQHKNMSVFFFLLF